MFLLPQAWVPSLPIWLSEKARCEMSNPIYSILMYQGAGDDSNLSFVKMYDIKIIEANIILVHNVWMQMTQHHFL